MKIGALFAGYGGLDLAVQEVLDAHVAWVSEFDKGPSRILAQRFPDAPNLGDITKIDWASVEPVDIITGGSPCQDLSHAGKRLGMKAGTRSGLWVSMLEAIITIKPKLVIWENVGGAFSAEATSEMEQCPGCVGDGTERPVLRALGRVLGDLTKAGYDAEWHSLRAADIGAPHGRLRVFVIAWPREAGKPRLDGRALVSNSESDGCETHGFASRPGTQVTGAAHSFSLLPTPAVNDMGKAYDPDSWDEWVAKQKANHGNGNGHGKSLHIEALRLLPTPEATQSGSTPEQHLARKPGRSRVTSLNIVAEYQLLPTPTAERPDGRKSDAFREGRTTFFDVVEQDQWGEYAPAVARWEALTRPAPASTLPTGREGKHQLSAPFVEWMMGLPPGWVTDTDTTRNEQLKALGNGVVPQQAAEAIKRALSSEGAFLLEDS